MIPGIRFSLIVGMRSSVSSLPPPSMNSIRSAALLLVLSIVGVSTTNAQTTYTWTGGSGSWFVENNWSPAGIPGAIDTAIVEVGTPELTQETTVASVDFSGAALTGDELAARCELEIRVVAGQLHRHLARHLGDERLTKGRRLECVAPAEPRDPAIGSSNATLLLE